MNGINQEEARQPGSIEEHAEAGIAVEAHAPRRLTVRENAILTIKVFAIAGALGAALWGINLWTAAK